MNAGRRFNSQNREKLSWLVKKSKEKEKERCSDQEFDCCSMWINIKTVLEEHLSSENITFCSSGWWSDDEVPS